MNVRRERRKLRNVRKNSRCVAIPASYGRT